MTEIQLEPHEIEAFLRERRRRDELATKIGVATYEFEVAKAKFITEIGQSQREERALGEMLMKKYGIEGDCRIDIENGKLVTP